MRVMLLHKLLEDIPEDFVPPPKLLNALEFSPTTLSIASVRATFRFDVKSENFAALTLRTGGSRSSSSGFRNRQDAPHQHFRRLHEPRPTISSRGTLPQ